MAQIYNVEAKVTHDLGGQRFVKGMNVEVVSNTNPMSTNEGREMIQREFMRKYNVDVKRANGFTSSNLKVEKK